MSTTITNGIRKETITGPINLRRIYKADFQKEETLTAELEQEVVTKSFYPSKKVASDMQSSLFSTEEFGFSEQEFTSTEKRIAWVLVPPSKSEAEVKAMLVAAAKNGAVIYRVLSNAPVLDENQKYAINAGIRTIDDFAKTQVVRVPENEETVANGTANHLLLDKAGNVQYRRTFYWKTKIADVDSRDAVNVYMSPEIEAELKGASIMEGQNL